MHIFAIQTKRWVRITVSTRDSQSRNRSSILLPSTRKSRRNLRDFLVKRHLSEVAFFLGRRIHSLRGVPLRLPASGQRALTLRIIIRGRCAPPKPPDLRCIGFLTKTSLTLRSAPDGAFALRRNTLAPPYSSVMPDLIGHFPTKRPRVSRRPTFNLSLSDLCVAGKVLIASRLTYLIPLFSGGIDMVF